MTLASSTALTGLAQLGERVHIVLLFGARGEGPGAHCARTYGTLASSAPGIWVPLPLEEGARSRIRPKKSPRKKPGENLSPGFNPSG